jgi:hypothetical protein
MASQDDPSPPDKSRYARSLVRQEPMAPTLNRSLIDGIDGTEGGEPYDDLAVPRDMRRRVMRERSRATPLLAIAALVVALVVVAGYVAWPYFGGDTVPTASTAATSQPPLTPAQTVAALPPASDAAALAQKAAAVRARKAAEKARQAAIGPRERLAKAERDRKEALRRAKHAEQARLEDSKLNQARIDQARLDQQKFDQARIDQLKADQTKQQELKQRQAKLQLAKLQQAKLLQQKAAREQSAALSPQSAPGEAPPLDATDLPPRAVAAAPQSEAQ